MTSGSESGALVTRAAAACPDTQRLSADPVAMHAGLWHVLELLADSAPLERLLTALLETLEQHSASGMLGSILLLDAGGEHLRHGAAPSLPDAYNRAIDGIAIGPGMGACGTAAHTGLPAHAQDIQTDPHWRDFRALAGAHGLRACWSTPILSRAGRVLGTFAMYYRESRAPDSTDLALVNVATRTAMLAIERKSTETALRENERLLTQVFEAAPTFMAVLRGPDLVFEKVNHAYHRLVGTQRALVGKPLLEALPELAGTPFPNILLKVLATGETCYGKDVPVLLQRSPDGPLEECRVDFVYESLRDASADISGVLVHGIDLTLRIKAEQRLRESEQRQRFIMDAMPQKIFTATALGNVDYFNPIWSEFTGLSFDQIRDWGWTQFIHPDDVEENVRRWQHAIDTGEPFEMEHRFRHRDGDYRWHISRAVAMKDDTGKALSWIGSNTDIHEQKQHADALRALADELSGADRRKNEFIAMLAHELRNPLTPLANALHVIQLSDGKDDVVRSLSGVMERQVAQLVRLVDDLLDIGRISRGKIELRRERTSLASAVHGAVEACHPLADARRQTLTATLPSAPVWLDADPARLTQVLGNLLTNACKFTPDGGRIEIDAHREGDEAVIRVIDDGIGIAPEHLSRIFDLFTQLDTSLERSVHGLGIGLSLVRTLVEMQGGRVEARSAGVGQGSEFVVRLPAVNE